MASSHYKKSNAIQNHTSNKADEVVQLFTDMMIEKMTALKNQKWEKGWFNGQSFEGLPQNFSGRNYNGSNTFFLYMNTSMKGYSMPVYLTFDQAKKNDLKINKGEKSFPVLYWNLSIKDKNGNNLPFEDYRKLSKEEREECYVKPFLKTYPVFNVDQTNFKEVKPEEYEKLRKKFEIPEIKDAEGMYTHNALDNVVKNQTWVCPVQSDKLSDEAYYSPSRDVVVLPMKAQFKKHETEEEIYRDGMQFYSTMLHEMAHSTGHKDRLNRVGGFFGDPKYAKEELVAELTAAMIGNSMGFDSKITDNSAKYLDNWLGALKEDPKFIVSVMADVNKAADMILDKVDEQRLALGETPYLSKNLVTVENGYSLEPEFKPAQELLASEPIHSYYGSLKTEEKEQLNHSLVEQYNRMKEKHPDAVLLFRVGNNYMLFKEDTKIGKEILGLEISERNVPGIGILQYSEFKHSDLDKQLPKLPRAGLRVAICEQTFDPKLERQKISRGISNEIPQEKSYKELSEREQQKKERELIKDFSKDTTIAIINSYQKKYEPKKRPFFERELPVSYSLLFQGLISYHQFYAASSPKEYAKFCLSNELEPDYASAKQLWRNNNESGQPNVYMFPSSGEILHQREQKVDKYKDQELKILAVKELCLNIKKPTPFLNDLEKKGLITAQEKNKVEKLLNNDITMAKKKKSEGQVELVLTQKQLEEMPVGSQVILTDRKTGDEFKFIKDDYKGWSFSENTGIRKGGADHEDTLKFLKDFITINHKIDFVTPQYQSIQEIGNNPDKSITLSVINEPNGKEQMNIYLKNGNKLQNYTIDKEDLNAWKNAEEGFSKNEVERQIKLKYLPKKIIAEFQLDHIEKMKENKKPGDFYPKAEEKKDEAVKQPREPQMVTVNGDKVSHAHVFTKKDNPEQWFFIAQINDKYLPSVPISQQEADNYRVNKNVAEMMEKYYPTKVMPKISDNEFKAGQKIMRNDEELKIEKFNVYKESKPERENYGKYVFYAKVNGQSMSILAKQEDLNAYFDKVKTPAQLVEKLFGERLQLPNYYAQFKAPEGFDSKQIKFLKDEASNRMLVYLDRGEAGKTKGKFVSYDDWNNYKNQNIATREQIGVKYFGSEIKELASVKTENKQEQTAKLKI